MNIDLKNILNIKLHEKIFSMSIEDELYYVITHNLYNDLYTLTNNIEKSLNDSLFK